MAKNNNEKKPDVSYQKHHLLIMMKHHLFIMMPVEHSLVILKK